MARTALAIWYQLQTYCPWPGSTLLVMDGYQQQSMISKFLDGPGGGLVLLVEEVEKGDKKQSVVVEPRVRL